jgi:hypothetical protein
MRKLSPCKAHVSGRRRSPLKSQNLSDGNESRHDKVIFRIKLPLFAPYPSVPSTPQKLEKSGPSAQALTLHARQNLIVGPSCHPAALMSTRALWENSEREP